MKFFLSCFLFFFCISFSTAQQNKKLLKIKEKYDLKLRNLQDKCYGKSYMYLKNPEKVIILDKNCAAEEEILDAKRSAENASELAKIKARISKFQYSSAKNSTPLCTSCTSVPKYPTGINGFRKEVQENFNTAVIKGKNLLRTEISFIVEEDGSISEVDSKGSNKQLNREAEIAVYLTKMRWTPAFDRGKPARYRFHLPMTFNFE